jgi:hypothetical protein
VDERKKAAAWGAGENMGERYVAGRYIDGKEVY